MRGGWAGISKNRLILVAIVVLTFCTVWIGYGVLESAKFEQQAQNKSREYAEYTRDKVAEACVGIAKADKIKCLNEAFEVKREYEYNQSDLVAQRQSALWAYIMAAAAVFGIALSAVGVWLVKTTFDETRRSNEIASATQRPWIDLEIGLDGIAKSENGYVLRIVIIAKNIGLSPAIHLRYAVDGFFWYEMYSREKIEFGNVRSKMNAYAREAVKRVEANHALSCNDGLTIFPSDKITLYVEEEIVAPPNAENQHLMAWLVVAIRYSFGRDEGQTVKVFNVRSFGKPNESGFDTIGEYGICFTDTTAKIVDWDSGGYAT